MLCSSLSHVTFLVYIIAYRRLISDGVVFQEVTATLRWWPQEPVPRTDQFLGSGSMKVKAAVLLYRQVYVFLPVLVLYFRLHS
jgi:hypothetical protein